MPKSTIIQGVRSPFSGKLTPSSFVTMSVTMTCMMHSRHWYSICARTYALMCMPERCSLFSTSLSRHTTWIELKQPFQIQMQAKASVPISVPSEVKKKSAATTIDTRPAIRAAIGRTFQSPSKINIRRNLTK